MKNGILKKIVSVALSAITIASASVFSLSASAATGNVATLATGSRYTFPTDANAKKTPNTAQVITAKNASTLRTALATAKKNSQNKKITIINVTDDINYSGNVNLYSYTKLHINDAVTLKASSVVVTSGSKNVEISGSAYDRAGWITQTNSCDDDDDAIHVGSSSSNITIKNLMVTSSKYGNNTVHVCVGNSNVTVQNSELDCKHIDKNALKFAGSSSYTNTKNVLVKNVVIDSDVNEAFVANYVNNLYIDSNSKNMETAFHGEATAVRLQYCNNVALGDKNGTAYTSIASGEKGEAIRVNSCKNVTLQNLIANNDYDTNYYTILVYNGSSNVLFANSVRFADNVANYERYLSTTVAICNLSGTTSEDNIYVTSNSNNVTINCLKYASNVVDNSK